MWCCVPVTVLCVLHDFPVCWVTDPASTCCVYLTLNCFCGTFPSLLSLPPILLQSRHPHQHVSGAVRVSIYDNRNCTPLRPDWNAPPSSLPPLLAHLPPPTSSHQLSQDCTACCPPAWLPASSTGWTCNRKHNSPHCLLPTTSCSSLEPEQWLSESIQPPVDHLSLLFLSLQSSHCFFF